MSSLIEGTDNNSSVRQPMRHVMAPRVSKAVLVFAIALFYNDSGPKQRHGITAPTMSLSATS
jgi:hypothetical protein